MDLRNLIKWSVILIAIIAFKRANAVEIEPDSYPPETVSASEAMPDHVAYLALLELAGTSGGVEHEQLVQDISAHLQFSRERSERFLEYLITANDSLAAANDDITHRLLCRQTDSRNDAHVYKALDTIRDIRETNLRTHYHHAVVSVGKENREALRAWLAEFKNDTTHEHYNHQALYEQMGMDPQTVVAASCNRLAGFYK